MLVLGLSACGGVGAPGEQDPTIRDSAGVRIVEHRASSLTDATRWRVSAEPVWQVGGAAGPEEYQFHRVVGALRLADGSIVVADAGAGLLRWFDADGRAGSSAGRPGEGPGEFRALSWIGRASGDSVLAWDRQLRRTSIFVDGRFIRDARADLPADRPMPAAAGALEDGTILAIPGPVYVPEERPGVQRPPMPLWLVSPAGRIERTLGPFPGTAVHLRPAATPGGWIRTEVPFGPTTLAVAAADRIVVADNATFELRILGPDGGLRTIIRIDAAPRPVRDEDLNADLERRLAAVPPIEAIREGVRVSFAETPAAETMPFFDALKIDTAGNIWVRWVPRDTEDAPDWAVFGPDGSWLGRAGMPLGLAITDIGDDHVLGVWKDDLDVEYLRMYALTEQALGAAPVHGSR